MIEYEYDIIRREIKQSSRVITLIKCDSNRFFCPAGNSYKGPEIRHCTECMSKFQHFYEILVSEEKGINLINKKRSIRGSENIEWLLNQLPESVKDKAVQSARSTYMTQKRDPAPDINDDKKFYNRLVLEFIDNYNFIKTLPLNIDKIYLFNGRLVNYRPYLLHFKELMPKVYEYPWFDHERYIVNEGYYPHDLIKFSLDIYAKFSLSEFRHLKYKLHIGSSWFESRLKNINVDATGAFHKNSNEDFLEDKETNYFVFFTSSEDEMGGIDEFFQNSIYESQLLAIKNIYESLPKNTKLIVRIHPRLKGVQNVYEKRLISYCFNSDIILFKADSKINSYYLAKISKCVISFGSTIGAESAYLEKISIVLSPAPYQCFNIAFFPKNHYELIVLLNKCANNTIVKIENVKENACKYAYALMTYGIKTKYAKKTKYESGYVLANNKYIKIRSSLFIHLYNIIIDGLQRRLKNVYKLHK
jgi:hypothetical protein